MKKFFSIILAVVLLASHMSLTIGTHMCRGEAIETRIIYGGSHLLGCGMEDMNEIKNWVKNIIGAAHRNICR